MTRPGFHGLLQVADSLEKLWKANVLNEFTLNALAKNLFYHVYITDVIITFNLHNMLIEENLRPFTLHQGTYDLVNQENYERLFASINILKKGSCLFPSYYSLVITNLEKSPQIAKAIVSLVIVSLNIPDNLDKLPDSLESLESFIDGIFVLSHDRNLNQEVFDIMLTLGCYAHFFANGLNRLINGGFLRDFKNVSLKESIIVEFLIRHPEHAVVLAEAIISFMKHGGMPRYAYSTSYTLSLADFISYLEQSPKNATIITDSLLVLDSCGLASPHNKQSIMTEQLTSIILMNRLFDKLKAKKNLTIVTVEIILSHLKNINDCYYAFLQLIKYNLFDGENVNTVMENPETAENMALHLKVTNDLDTREIRVFSNEYSLFKPTVRPKRPAPDSNQLHDSLSDTDDHAAKRICSAMQAST